MVEILYADRNCDVCGSIESVEIFAYRTKARTRGGTYEWRIRNVVCRDCGFAFVSPAPQARSLSAYYSESFPYWRGELVELSIERRLEFARRHVGGSRPQVFVEIGPNATDGFSAALAPHIGRYTSVEPNGQCPGDLQSIGELPRGSADIVAAYFVLEHVADPKREIGSFADALKVGGKLLVEVPNLLVYDQNPAGIAHFEHTTHFSPRSLEVLAAGYGLNLVEVSTEDCSRPYGFAAAFMKSGIPERQSLAEFALAQHRMTAGAKLVAESWADRDLTRKRIAKAAMSGASVVFWAANKLCADLLDGFAPPRGSVFVDSDPNRCNYLHPFPVVLPDQAAGAIAKAGLFVIATELHSAEILRSIAQRRGAPLSADQYVVLNPGFAIGIGPRQIEV